MSRTVLHVGFDDTDSPKRMCTTFLAYRAVAMLVESGARFLDFPWLVRLNPNVPWKTRGNGAVALKLETSSAAAVKTGIIDMVKRHADTSNGANPGLVFIEGDSLPDELGRFSAKALRRLVGRADARRLARRHGIESYLLGNGQGLVGALGAVGYSFQDSTLELLAYRRSDLTGTERRISAASVERMQDAFPRIFNSYDERTRRILIAPRGPDPVLYGIRGEEPEHLLAASGMIDAGEEPVGHLLFRSNQGTGDHLQNRLDLADLRPYDSGFLEGTVSSESVVGRGGDVFFDVEAKVGSIRCAVYRETGITRFAAQLGYGDRVRVGGGIRRASATHPRALNVEYLRLLVSADLYVMVNPECPSCGKRMKSRGRCQGYGCRRCGSEAPSKVASQVPRHIQAGLYVPVPAAQRHLTRPLSRMGRRSCAAFDGRIPWFRAYEE